MKKVAWKVIIVSLPVVAICIYYLSSWIPMIPVAYTHIANWWEEMSEEESDWDAEWRVYLDGLEPPKLYPEEVAKLLEKQKTIKTKQLYDMVNWYVNEENATVIKQVIANLRFEKKVSLPEERSPKAKGVIYYGTGSYPVPLWSADNVNIIPICRGELLRYATSRDTDPHFIYDLMEILPRNSSKNRFFERVFHDDILAYLRIYANYKGWPTIRESAKRSITDYPCGWNSWDTLNEVFKIADEEGAERAYELYIQRYQSNYQTRSSEFRDRNDPKKKYKYESVFQGWSSENVNGRTQVYNVDSDQVVIGIPNVQKMILVLRDGEDITSICKVTPKNVLMIPLKVGKVVELQYKIHVTHRWWKYYYYLL